MVRIPPKKFTKEEIKLMREMDAISELANSIPEIRNKSVPESLWLELKRDIREYEKERQEKELVARRNELIQLGLLYEKKCRYRKYYVLAATIILVLSLGITSFGEADRIFYNIKTMIHGREQEIVDSEGLIPNEYVNEEEAYSMVEEQLGVAPVKLDYLPKDVEFIESSTYDELLGSNLCYGKGNVVKLIYMIRPNYREGSWAKDIEDELLGEYEIELSRVVIQLKEYKVSDGTTKWLVYYKYNNVSYSIMMLDMEKNEVEKIVQGLYFKDDKF